MKRKAAAKSAVEEPVNLETEIPDGTPEFSYHKWIRGPHHPFITRHTDSHGDETIYTYLGAAESDVEVNHVLRYASRQKLFTAEGMKTMERELSRALDLDIGHIHAAFIDRPAELALSYFLTDAGPKSDQSVLRNIGRHNFMVSAPVFAAGTLSGIFMINNVTEAQFDKSILLHFASLASMGSTLLGGLFTLGRGIEALQHYKTDPNYIENVRGQIKTQIIELNKDPDVAARRKAWLAMPPTQAEIDEATVENAYREEMKTQRENFESAESTRQEALDSAAEEARKEMLKTRIELARIEAQRNYYNARNPDEGVGKGILARLKSVFGKTPEPQPFFAFNLAVAPRASGKPSARTGISLAPAPSGDSTPDRNREGPRLAA